VTAQAVLVTSDSVSDPNVSADDWPDSDAGRPMTEKEKVAARRAQPNEGRGKKKRTYPWWVEFPIILVVALLLLALFNSFIGRPYVIPSESMEPTLHGCDDCEGDRIFVNKLAYQFGGEPSQGDVVVFTGPESWNDQYVSQRSDNSVVSGLQTGLSYIGILAPDENTLVKRVIATGGQTVQCQEGDPGVMVDGEKVDDSYTKEPLTYKVDPLTGSDACQGSYFGPVTVPEGNVWVMGDNRTNSGDSRFHLGDENQGTVPVDNVVGKVTAKIWPLSRIGGVDDPDIQS
jgi:signal peptidase I